ncbi:MAG: HAMP domain-containing sensor histidine kinase [Rickettsiales bacterium]
MLISSNKEKDRFVVSSYLYVALTFTIGLLVTVVLFVAVIKYSTKEYMHPISKENVKSIFKLVDRNFQIIENKINNLENHCFLKIEGGLLSCELKGQNIKNKINALPKEGLFIGKEIVYQKSKNKNVILSSNILDKRFIYLLEGGTLRIYNNKEDAFVPHISIRNLNYSNKRKNEGFLKKIAFLEKYYHVVYSPHSKSNGLSKNTYLYLGVVLFLGVSLSIVVSVFMYNSLLRNYMLNEANKNLRKSRGNLRRLLSAQKKLNQELSEAYNTLDDFMKIASHDLKEPLRGINLNSDILKEDLKNSHSRDLIKRADRIQLLAKKSYQLVEDLAYISRIANYDMHLEDVSLSSIVRSACDLLIDQIDKDEIKIIISSSLSQSIKCSKLYMTQVFYNLISNAIRYNNKKEKIIEIGVGKINDLKYFFVKDNGNGIAKQFHKVIFKMFKKLDTGLESKKGSGVGLSIVKKIIERHQGDIWVESSEGNGAKFCFTIQGAR